MGETFLFPLIYKHRNSIHTKSASYLVLEILTSFLQHQAIRQRHEFHRDSNKITKSLAFYFYYGCFHLYIFSYHQNL